MHCIIMIEIGPFYTLDKALILKLQATIDVNSGCTVSHTGTSAAAPLAAGIVALLLEAK